MNTTKEKELQELLDSFVQSEELSILAKELARKLLDNPAGAYSFIHSYMYDKQSLDELVSYEEAIEIYKQERAVDFLSSGEPEVTPEMITDCPNKQVRLVYSWMDLGIKQITAWLMSND